MYPPSPRGLGNDAGSVTFISCLADAIVRPYAVGEIGEKDIRVVDIQYGLTVLKSLCADENLLSMWLVYRGSASAIIQLSSMTVNYQSGGNIYFKSVYR
jgi:hypothetical protein